MGGRKLQKSLPKLFLKSKGEVVDEAKEAELFAKARYDEQVSPYAASRLWTDAIIDPLDTVLGFLWVLKQQPFPIEKKFNLGVIQV
jgi:hypothetical protein